MYEKIPVPRSVCCGNGLFLLYWGQVIDMDRNKTGDLIAAARKGKNMTQKELAAALHVSDRAVSKWERSAGFPDSHGQRSGVFWRHLRRCMKLTVRK